MSGFKSGVTDYDALNKRVKELGLEPFYTIGQPKLKVTWQCTYCGRTEPPNEIACTGECMACD